MDIKEKTKKVLKFVIAISILATILITAVSCQGIFYIPGVSLGYFIWRDKTNQIHIVWSADRKKTSFGGSITTDGTFADYKKIGLEDSDIVSINNDNNKIVFDTALSENDYSDEIVLNIKNYTYLEFELKINNSFDLARINIGRFLANPQNDIFRIDNEYFDNLKNVPFYKKHPWSGFFSKLAGDIHFTLFFISILGIVVIELIRITILSRKKKYNWYLILLYALLIFIDSGIYLFLTRLNFY